MQSLLACVGGEQQSRARAREELKSAVLLHQSMAVRKIERLLMRHKDAGSIRAAHMHGQQGHLPVKARSSG